MNLALATGPLAQAIGWALLHLVWQGALVAALLALVLVLLSGRAASLRYAVSCGALALVVMMGVVTGVRSYPGRVAAQPKLDPSPSRTFLVLPSAVSPITVATFPPARVDRLRDLARTADRALPAIVTFWLLGVALLTARLVIQWLQARRLVTGSASPAREPWPSLARRLALALGVRHAVRLLESTAIEVPAVLGVLRPVILLPASAVTGLTTAQLEMILAHELAHIRRHDFLVNLFQSAVETLLFYHPAVWWISRQMRIERENCCDDLAVAVCGTPLQYARALARLEELRADAMPLAVSAKGGSLMERIRRIVRGSRVEANPVRGATALAVLVLGLLAIAGPSLSAMSRRQTDVKWSRRHRSASFTRFESRAAEARDAESRHAEARDADCPDKVEVKEEAQRDEAADAALAGEESQQATAAVVEGDEEANADARFMAQIAGMHGHQRLSLDELIQLRQQDVTPSEVLEMRFLFPGMDIREIAGMNAALIRSIGRKAARPRAWRRSA